MTDIELTYNKKLVLGETNSWKKFNFFQTKTRQEPSVFIIGAQKSGTTSLLGHLAQHPSIIQPRSKEIYYFNNINLYNKGMEWYLKQFPSSSNKANINIDATANYFESKDAPKRLKEKFPKAKIIILLRDPVYRAYSHYKMAVKLGFENLSFEEALSLEKERIDYSIKNYIPKYNHDYIFQRLGYRTKGEYATFLKEWLDCFSLDEILIIQSEQYFSETQTIYNDVLNFLHLEPHKLESLKILQKGNNTSIPKKMEEELTIYFQPFNKTLFNLIGKKYNWKS